MNTIGIIAEFNPFHNGHLHLIETCKETLKADRCIVIMSGDFVQRGAPALVDKFTRAKMALNCGADVVIELPVYYALGSAEFFARGAVSILDKLGCIEYLCFGSECGNIDLLTNAARILNEEPDFFKDVLAKELKKGQSFAAAREAALFACLESDKSLQSEKDKAQESCDSSVLSAPNNILGVEYIRALQDRNSKIKPYSIKRVGEGYHSKEIDEFSSASAIRSGIFSITAKSSVSDSDMINSNCIDFSAFEHSVPAACISLLKDYEGSFADTDKLSLPLNYKLLSEKNNGFTKYLDVTEDLSNKITSAIENFSTFDQFCTALKTKDLAYSRISRALCHILLNITASNMDEYKADGYTSYARILGMKKASSDLVKLMRENASIPVIGNLKEAGGSALSDLQKRLFEETLLASQIYHKLYLGTNLNEYKSFMLI